MTDASDAQPSDYSSRAAQYLEPEVTPTALMSLEVYQRQHSILDRYWAYFNQYCLMMLTLSVLAVAFREYSVIQNIRLAIVLVPIVTFVLLFIGNHVSITLGAAELEYMKAMAAAQSRIQLQSSGLGKVRSYHALMALLTLVIYVISWSYALWWGK